MTDFTAQLRHQSEQIPANAFTQRLLAADSAWHEFMAAYYASRFQNEPVVYQNLVFLSFAKFVLELVPDNHLRTQLFEYFELQFIKGPSTSVEAP